MLDCIRSLRKYNTQTKNSEKIFTTLTFIQQKKGPACKGKNHPQAFENNIVKQKVDKKFGANFV